jgi:hypothetical protein
VSFPASSKSNGFGRNSCTIPAPPAVPERRQMRRSFVDETREGARRDPRLETGASLPERRRLAITHHPTDFVQVSCMAINQVLTSLKRRVLKNLVKD